MKIEISKWNISKWNYKFPNKIKISKLNSSKSKTTFSNKKNQNINFQMKIEILKWKYKFPNEKTYISGGGYVKTMDFLVTSSFSLETVSLKPILNSFHRCQFWISPEPYFFGHALFFKIRKIKIHKFHKILCLWGIKRNVLIQWTQTKIFWSS